MPTEDKVTVTVASVPTELPVFICDLAPIRDHLRLAREAIEELRVSHPTPIQSNVYATYVSPWKSHLLNPKFAPLCQSVVTIANEMSKRILSANLEALNMDLVVTDCWGIVYEHADHTKLHNHFPADFGCAVYLEADEHCAPIVFSSGYQVQPKPESLVLFPGILNHEVPSNAGRRVVVAMNLNKRSTLQPAG